MFMCEKCGSVNGDVAVCPNCGTANPNFAAEPTQQAAQVNVESSYTPVSSAPVDAELTVDRGMGILAYLGIFVLFPIFAERNSKFARFHANQGLVILLCEVGYWIIQFLLTWLAGLISWRLAAVVGTIMGIISFLLGIVLLVFMIMGIVSALKRQTKPLPFIGKIKLLK